MACAWLIVTVQGSVVLVQVPPTAPAHPAKTDPAAAVASSVTTVPLGKLSVSVGHPVAQVTDGAVCVVVATTEPAPVPPLATLRARVVAPAGAVVVADTEADSADWLGGVAASKAATR